MDYISDDDYTKITGDAENLKHSRFKQQKMPAWKPVPTYGSTAVMFYLFGTVFLCIGIHLFIRSENMTEIVKEYDTDCGKPRTPPFNETHASNECVVEIHIKKDVKETIFLYYQLQYFYQSHRRFEKSVSRYQLKGHDLPFGDKQL